MSGKTGGNRGPRRAAALAVVAAVAVLAACGGSPSSSGGSASAGSATYRADLAYAQCMQTHGVPGFPDPSPSGGISISGHPHGNSPAARANDACEHLLTVGSTGTGGATAPATARNTARWPVRHCPLPGTTAVPRSDALALPRHCQVAPRPTCGGSCASTRPPQSAPATPLPARRRTAETATRTGPSRRLPRPKTGSLRWHNQRISPGRMTWTRLPARTRRQAAPTSSTARPRGRRP